MKATMPFDPLTESGLIDDNHPASWRFHRLCTLCQPPALKPYKRIFL